MPRRHAMRVLAQLLWRMRWDLVVLLLLCLVSLGFKPFGIDDLIDGATFPVLGIAVSIFLGFRNTLAINRWWEARGLWGQLVNQSRHWRALLLALLGPRDHPAGVHDRLLQQQVLMVWLANLELRNHGLVDYRQRVLALAGDLGFGADVTLLQVFWACAEDLHRLHGQGAVSDLGRDALLRSADVFITAVGGLQKIRNTPIPPAYDLFVRLIAWLFGYDLYLDFLGNGMAWSGALLFFGFLVAERIGAYVEGPFDRNGSSLSLPLDQICLGISSDLLGSDSPFADLPLCRDPSAWT